MRNRGARKFAAILALIAPPVAPVSAIDGEVLISQGAALAGGITPGDDPGFPVTISRSGKYKLRGNLNVPAGQHGIRVTAHYVTIDLNGFRIFGGGAAIMGINGINRDGLTVMNGTISNFTSHGIETRAYAIVQDMHITDSGLDGVHMDNNGRVLRSTISGSAGSGIHCNSKCLIAQSVLAGNAYNGVALLTGAGGHLVLGNVISGNQLYGIYSEGFTGFGNNTVTDNAFGTVVGVVPVHPNACQPACP
jgi:hypothetical protein